MGTTRLDRPCPFYNTRDGHCWDRAGALGAVTRPFARNCALSCAPRLAPSLTPCCAFAPPWISAPLCRQPRLERGGARLLPPARLRVGAAAEATARQKLYLGDADLRGLLDSLAPILSRVIDWALIECQYQRDDQIHRRLAASYGGPGGDPAPLCRGCGPASPPGKHNAQTRL